MTTLLKCKEVSAHAQKHFLKAKQLLITDKFLCFTLFGNEGLTGRDVS